VFSRKRFRDTPHSTNEAGATQTATYRRQKRSENIDAMKWRLFPFQVEGISVDTHVHRISNQLGWVGSSGPTKTPEHTRKAIESWMPRDIWPEVKTDYGFFGLRVNPRKNKL